MGLIQFDSKLSKQPSSNARLRDKWTSFSVLSQRGLTVLGGITKDVSIGGRGWQGNGSTKGAYVNASMSIAAAGGSGTDSLLIGVIFSSTVTTDGTLASFGVSTNTTGGYFQITHSGGALIVAADDAANVSGLSSVATSGFNDGLVHTAVALLRTRSDGRYQGLWVDGKFCASGTTGGFTATTFDRIAVACLRRNATGGFLPAGRYVYEAFYGKGFSADEAQNLSARRWDAFYAPKRIWVPVSAGGTHATTGALSADSATLSGTAVHTALHATSGALSAQSATVAGTATHNALHATSGALSASEATVSGAADHTTPGASSHPTTGALSADAANVAGTAAHYALHATTGALAAQEAAIAGTAVHNAVHATSGDLISDPASVSGSARNETGYVAPTPMTGAGKSRKPRRRIEVEVDGKVISVSSVEEAHAVLEDLREQAEKIAAKTIERAAVRTKTPVRKVLQDARKALQVPEIVAPKSLRDAANQIIGDIRSQYEFALASVEIAAFLAKREREIEEDDEEVLLLL